MSRLALNQDTSAETHWIAGTLLSGIAAFLGVSLLTYHTADPSFSSISSVATLSNAAGTFGAYLSDGLFILMGVGAYFFPLGLLACGIKLFLGKTLPKRLLIGAVLMLLALPPLVHLMFPRVLSPNLSGGLTGVVLSSLMERAFGYIGSFLVLLPLTGIATILFFHLSPKSLFLFSRDTLRTIFRWIRGSKPDEVPQSLVPSGVVISTYHPLPAESAMRTILPTRPEINRPQKVAAIPVTTGKEGYQLPSTALLADPKPVKAEDEDWVLRSQHLAQKLLDFSIEGKITQVHPGPVVTLFEFEPAPGIKLNRITSLQDDIALAMKASRVRIVAPLPEKATVGIEVPNVTREEVSLKEILTSPAFHATPSKLKFAFGKDIQGNPVVVNLATLPHLLVAGSTGSGKSVGLNSMILSLLFSAKPTEVQMLMIDPKMLEFSFYEGIPHLIAPVIVRAKQASAALRKMTAEMERRYQVLADKRVRNISQYNQHVGQESEAGVLPLPYVVIFIDELSDLMMVAGRDAEDAIVRLTQMGRAAGIHLVVATQRPSVDVVTGLIKANFPARVAYYVSSKTDSRTILDANGAEQLLGKGDMLYLAPGTSHLLRVHGAYVSEDEVKQVVSFVKTQEDTSHTAPVVDFSAESLSEDTRPNEDDVYAQARLLVMESGEASASFIQRKMRVGYPRAARLLEQMEAEGIVSKATGSRPREVLVKSETDPA